jgi:Predicted transcriptional regulators
MRIGELSRLSHVSARAIRHYEEKGLLTADRLENDYRDFSEWPTTWRC